MLPEELLVPRAAGLVCLRVTPPVQQVAALPTVAAAMPGRLFGRRAVIDHPDLAEVTHADHDLIELLVVVDGVGMVDVGNVAAEIDIDQFGMIGDHAIVRLCGIVVLDEMVPHTPFPDDISAAGPDWLDFNHAVGPEFAFAEPRGISSGRYGFGRRLILPGDQQHVAVWQYFQVMVRTVLFIPVIKLPDGCSVPCQLLDAIEGLVDQVAVVQQVRRTANTGGVPRMNEQSIVVDEIRHVGIYRREQRVAIGDAFVVLEEPDRRLIRPARRGTREEGDRDEADEQQNERLPHHTASPSLRRSTWR